MYRSHHASPGDGDDLRTLANASAHDVQDVQTVQDVHDAPEAASAPAAGRHAAHDDDEPRNGGVVVGRAVPPATPPVAARAEPAPVEPTRAAGTVYGSRRPPDARDDIPQDMDQTPEEGQRAAHTAHDLDDLDTLLDMDEASGRNDLDEFDIDNPEEFRKPRRRPRPTVMDGVRAGIRGFGELLITFGLVVLLFAAYEVWGKAAQVDAAQDELDRKIEDSWENGGTAGDPAPKAKPLPGDAISRLYIPRLDKHWVVVQGVSPGDIKNAPGHYPESAMPGQKGNFSVAGHRAKALFWDLDLMQPGDKIFVEDGEYFYEYRVTDNKIVLPNAVEVVAPVPGQPGKKPDERFLTLTTCNPKWDNYERLIVHAKMVGPPLPKADGMPPDLAKYAD